MTMTKQGQQLPNIRRGEAPTKEDADAAGRVWAFCKDLDRWEYVKWDDCWFGKNMYRTWVRTGLTAPPKPIRCQHCYGVFIADGWCHECNGTEFLQPPEGL